MRSPSRFTTLMGLAASMVLCQAGVSFGQLQWQANGAPSSQVQPASHTEPVVSRTKPALKRRAKAPTTAAAAPSNRPATNRAGGVQTAKQTAPAAPTSPPVTLAKRLEASSAAVAPASHVVFEGSVSPSCHDCGSGACNCSPCECESCQCGMGGAVGAPCCGEATCGLTLGEPCGCGSVGCAGECGMACGCGDVCECGDACGDNCVDGYCGLGGCGKRGAIPLVLFLPPVQELTLFGGVHSFKNPLGGPQGAGRDRGNFGFHEGFNIGGQMAWLPFPNLGYQIGYQAVHSQLHGDAATGDSDSHTQQFITAGLFRRRKVGFQYGVVYDWLRDERQQSLDFGQIRGSLSITNPCGQEIGFQFTQAGDNNTVNSVLYESANQYSMFYRVHGKDGGEFSLFGGGTDEGQGIFGGKIEAPLNKRVSFHGGFTYLIPEDTTAGAGGAEEAWNIGMNLVWHYGKRARSCYDAPFRPMYDVADNGSMIIDSK